MKKLTKALLLFSSIAFSQHEEFKSERIAQIESHLAEKKMNFKVNPNTQNYDLTYGKLEFTVDPAVYNISGKVTLTFKALASMNTVTFDLYKKTTPFTITSVKINGISTTFSHNSSHELVINLPSPLNIGNSASAEITYGGAPSTAEQAFTTSTHSGTPVLYTLSEPYGARDWWPCKQDLNDKIDAVDIYITAPSTYVSVANGLKQSEVLSGSKKTTHFKHNYPIPAYLIAIAVTNYVVKNTGIAGGNNVPATPTFPIIDYIYPESNTTTNATNLARTIPVLNFFETKLGAYPYNTEKYGHAQFGWGGGMEHTTVSFMNSFGRSLIAHELAHQWFGDKITCGSWKDIWLNEGLSEYMTGAVVENFDGASSFVSWKSSKISSVTSTSTGNLYLYDSQLTDANRIFSSQMTYNKGAMVVHMLRYIMGDTNFYQALRNYLNDPALAYKYALTPQFQAHLEAVHGSSLQEFFNDWVYKEGYPTYNITVSNSGTNQATVQVKQTRSITNTSHIGYVSYFEMPVPVRLTLSNGSVLDLKLNNTFSGQLFNISLPAGTSVSSIVFDPKKDIISRYSTAALTSGTARLSENLVSIYPNPSGNDELVTVNVGGSLVLEKVTVYDLLGQKVKESKKETIDLVGLKSGTYEVIVETNEGNFHKKIIKK
ncbi:M1 family aminopeptidase [Flavobacterium sp. H122]|uniref:M1 family aminopeptidase n=1 Tax=Flavobacterium sp. H122 TaxID=2529860 RepID=UPI0010AA157B|nr:M1 family aminopeptidase [Flavobacterium sp. H122]